MENKKTLEDALSDVEANKKRIADYEKEFAAEIEAGRAKLRAFDARMAALTQEERRKVLDAADLKHISAAPKPITPIPGASIQIEAARPQSESGEIMNIDWNFWRGMRKVLHWQACALSVGANPDTMGRRPGDSFWSYGSYHLDRLPETSQEIITKRLRLLEANRYERTIFTLPMTQYSGLNANEVLLSEFAAWGLSLGWGDMPQEFAAMAQPRKPIADLSPAGTEAPPVLSAAMSPMSQESDEQLLLDPIPLEQARKILHERFGATDAEIAMWICLGDLSAWRTTKQRFHESELGKRPSAGAAAKRLLTLNVFLSKSEIDAFNSDSVERFVNYEIAAGLIKDAVKNATEEAELLEEWRDIHNKNSSTKLEDRLYGVPQIAVLVPGKEYATQIEDGLVMKSQINIWLEPHRKQEAPPVSPAATLPVGVTEPSVKPKNNWDEYGLRRLLNEKNEGMTQQKLADKYGVSRQRIAVLLREARGQSMPRKASPFDALRPRNGKK